MYDVIFHTNVDCPKAGGWNFPKKVIAIPEIGHRVESANGAVLKVCSITHSWRDKSISNDFAGPILKIELTKEKQ